jgi:anion-transporting  ArsA/GET3 family ATPase
MLPIERRRFLFVTGKGGSGKTSVSAALALALSARGLRVLVVTSGPRERLSDLLGGPRLTAEIALIRRNLWGALLIPNVALREYGVLVLKSPTLVDALFGNKYVEGLFNGAPGLKEWALLGKAWYHSTETLPNGLPRFDIVIFDAPATGHGLDMLRVPKVILAAAPPGRLRVDAERAFESLQDPERSGIVVVTLPEEMPTNETLELVHALQSELKLPIAEIVLNSTLSPIFADDETIALEPFARIESSEPVEGALAAAARRALAERTQAESRARVQALGLPIRELPRLADGGGTEAAALSLSALF